MAEANNIPIITVKQPYKTNDGTTLYMGTSTEVKRDANGKYVPGSAVTSLRLYDTTFSPLGTDYKTVATREAGKPWNLTRDGNGNYVAGANLRQTLATPNSSLNTNLNNHVSGALGAPLQGVPARQVNPNTKQDVERALGTNSNTAQEQPNADQQSGNPTQTPSGQTPPAPQLPGPGDTSLTPNPSQSLIFASPTGLRYPKQITNNQDRVKFQAAELLERTNSTPKVNSGFQFEFPQPKLKNVDGPVIIAIQSPISDQNSVDWGPDTVNAIDSALFGVSLGFMEHENPEGQATNFYRNLLQGAGNYSSRIQKYLAGQAASINNILARTDNVVLNPNLELLFQGPQLRPFTFTFKMSARNQPEANEIRRIINYFKYHMAVRKESGLFLKAPHVFKIQYEKGEGEIHPGINLISPRVRDDKACALTNCSVDYTPLGSYMTYEDGTMVAYTLNLQFQDLTPILDTDYNDIYNPNLDVPMSIGY